MKLTNPRQLNTDDFEEDYTDLVEGIATPFNSQFTEVYNALDNNLDFNNNINSTIASFQVSVDSTGTPNANVVFKLKPTQKQVQGIQVIALKDNNGNAIIPEAAPYVTASQDGNLMIVKNIKGLLANTVHNCTVLVL